MKILQIASLGLPVSPDLKYGGTERVISYLDAAYTERGHDSLVAATGDSEVRGKLIETVPQSLWNLNGTVSVTRAINRNKGMTDFHYKKCIDYLLEHEDIDIAHDHPGSGLVTGEYFENVKDRIRAPILITLHGAVADKYKERYANWARISREGKIHFNAISQSQKREFEAEGIKVEDIVYHGIPVSSFVPGKSSDDFLFNIGRVAPEKGQDLAVRIAKDSGRRLIMAGEVHSINEAYWEESVKPYVDGDQIQFLGSLTDEEKIPYFQKAAALIFPLQWKEPFGLVMIESMACGTPVIAYDRGSVPEVVKNGETGFVIRETGNREADLEAMVQAVNDIDSISPEACRKHVEDNFSIDREAVDYLRLYQRLIDSN